MIGKLHVNHLYGYKLLPCKCDVTVILKKLLTTFEILCFPTMQKNVCLIALLGSELQLLFTKEP